jgi:hypothetical protein
MITWVFDKIVWVFSALIISVDADPLSLQRHRTVVSLMIIGIYMIVGAHLLWDIPPAQGIVSQIELNKVQTASDTKFEQLTKQMDYRTRKLEGRENSIELLIVRGSIKKALDDACTALQNANQPALDSANKELDDLADQYQTLTSGRIYIRPSCDTVLIKPNRH